MGTGQYKTLAELKTAIDGGGVPNGSYFLIDNDDVAFFGPLDEESDTQEKFFSCEPRELMESALDLLGFKWEHC